MSRAGPGRSGRRSRGRALVRGDPLLGLEPALRDVQVDAGARLRGGRSALEAFQQSELGDPYLVVDVPLQRRQLPDQRLEISSGQRRSGRSRRLSG